MGLGELLNFAKISRGRRMESNKEQVHKLTYTHKQKSRQIVFGHRYKKSTNLSKSQI